MKTTKILSILALSLFVVTSCDNGFDELNKSRTSAIAVDEVFILNNAIINSAAPAGTLQYDLGIIQQIISSNSGVIAGANFNVVNNDNAAANWQNYYRNVIKYTSDVQVKTKDVPARANLYNMARIIQSYAFMILTDTYGDIPYTEAGQGYNTSNFFPKYDAQSTIYPAIITEITAATTALNASGTLESAEALYSGNIAQWKKFGNSLLLRAGMRLSKVNPALAQSTVAAAVDPARGGLILVTAENAVMRNDANYVNGVGNTLNSTEAANYYLTKPFVDFLKANNDPRLTAIAVRYTTATSGTGQTTAGPDSTPANQYGMPVGSDDATAQDYALNKNVPPLASRYAFTQVDRNRMASKLAPMFMVTASQTNLLLAEARFRGWISTGTAIGYYNTGIAEAMAQLAVYGSTSSVTNTNRDAYIASRATVFPGNELREINYEYWVASFLNGQETWANFRRSGYPALAPNPYPGRLVPFITRLTYPVTENLVNTANYNAAVSTMGGDKLDGKVWWDK